MMQIEDVKTFSAADEMAKRLFGRMAYAYDRGDGYTRAYKATIGRYYVGTGSTLYGNGDTWQAAFKDAVKMAVHA